MTQPSVKALKEVVVLRIRLQSHQVHLTMLQYYTVHMHAMYTKYNTHNNESTHSEIGSVRQNPIQRTVRSRRIVTLDIQLTQASKQLSYGL